eukprot:c8223_g1_i1 orf=22-306(+)
MLTLMRGRDPPGSRAPVFHDKTLRSLNPSILPDDDGRSILFECRLDLAPTSNMFTISSEFSSFSSLWYDESISPAPQNFIVLDTKQHNVTQCPP